MKIALIEAFYSGSHQKWADEYQRFSDHEIQIFSLPGKYWKWRMHGAAITLAKAYLASNFKAELLLCTDMINLPVFMSLVQKEQNIPIVVYFHENQLAYPWSKSDPDPGKKRDYHYHFINYTTALCADQNFFNSTYHLESFNRECSDFLRIFPDFKNLETLREIQKKSSVLSLGLDLRKLELQQIQSDHSKPVILWNHRWEYDKNPELFFKTLFELSDEGIEFELILLGESYQRSPAIFGEAAKKLDNHIIHAGFASSWEEYAQWLWKATIYPVTSKQDFFGASVVEALYTGSIPLLPRRLAFPEHIPISAEWCLYSTDDEFKQKLRELLLDKMQIDTSAIQSHVSKYDWSNMVKLYDQSFEALTI